MDKQKRTQLVLQKIKEKKEQEERNRPHFEVLRLLAKFSYQKYASNKSSIQQLTQKVKEITEINANLQKSLDELDQTGKRLYPRIIIKSQFIASEKVKPLTKEFYYKASNNYLTTFYNKMKVHEESVKEQKIINEEDTFLKELESIVLIDKQKQLEYYNAKQVKVLKEDLRLRSILNDQEEIKKTIQEERNQNILLLREYQIKKVNLENRKNKLKQLIQDIKQEKINIQSIYNPISYREQLKKMFQLRTKNEMMEKNLITIAGRVKEIQSQTERYERTLQKSSSLLILGKCSDSPSTRKGSIQKRMLSLSKQQNGSNSRIRLDESFANIKRARNYSSGEKNYKSIIHQTPIKESVKDLEETKSTLMQERLFTALKENVMAKKLFI